MHTTHSKWFLLINLGLLALVLLGCNSAPPEPIKVELAVTGMTCETCENAITAQLLKQEGVLSATASHQAESVTVEYDPELCTEELIVSTIESLNFDVKDAGTTPGSA